MENNNDIKKIVNKWYSENPHGHFICFKDNDLKNDSPHNIEYISFKEAIKKRLTCNWTWGLNDKEINYVKENWDYFINY
jgi:hypothetical protein